MSLLAVLVLAAAVVSAAAVVAVGERARDLARHRFVADGVALAVSAGNERSARALAEGHGCTFTLRDRTTLGVTVRLDPGCGSAVASAEVRP